jgi:ferritin-like metal-binding protein YciE
MESLIKAREIIESCESGSMRDAYYICSSKVEHYEIAAYVIISLQKK